MKGRNGKEGKIAHTDNCFFISHRIFIFNYSRRNRIVFLSRRNGGNGRNFIFSLILMSIDNHAAWLGEAH
ncbi:MAG: hypothetical protein IKM73_08560, partial [Acidaminococcaceae bacterium]|nr:hypothetical protein [Acidaminococcaceae bacterium]